MSFYYPGIADDDDSDADDLVSSCSADIEGRIDDTAAAVMIDPDIHLKDYDRKGRPIDNGVYIIDDDRGGGNCSVGDKSDGAAHDIIESSISMNVKQNAQDYITDRNNNTNTKTSAADFGGGQHQQQTSNNAMAEMIQNERNRRLGVQENNNTQKKPIHRSSASDIIGEDAAQSNNAAAGVGVLENIRGWFGGAGQSVIQSQYDSSLFNNSTPNLQRKESMQYSRKSSTNTNDDDNDDQLSSSSSDDESDDDSESDYSSDDESDDASCSEKYGGDADLTPQERARASALQYLSNQCVDTGRKAKSASYVRGLERLDLKRKRDRFEKELEIVESEMNMDRGLLGNNNKNDEISKLAATLVRELPCIQGADAGAGSDVGKDYMSYDEYAESLNNSDGTTIQSSSSIWENKQSVDAYMNSLQSRLKKSLDQTRSLEKRLAVLETAGDDIVSSLCEDLVDVTSHSNKNEARYVKKGKELQRKRRREEMRRRTKIKRAERVVKKFEERLMVVSGVRDLEKELHIDPHSFLDGTDDLSIDSVSSGEKDDEDDEVLLEQKLSTIKAKNERDKEEHISEVESIRRQCEQLKLRLSVVRLVMEGDDNLREYVALLGRFNPDSKQQRRNSTIDDEEFSPIQGTIPAPPSRITKARAKLIKVTHLGQIYEQRLAVSKAFTDATINALDQELVERETASQKMEVRCLNELVMIDAGIKDIAKETHDKLVELQSEANELEDAVNACAAEKQITDVNAMFGNLELHSKSITIQGDKKNEPISERIKPWRNTPHAKHTDDEPDNTDEDSDLSASKREAIPDHESTSESSTKKDSDMEQAETELVTFDAELENEVDKGSLPQDPPDAPLKENNTPCSIDANTESKQVCFHEDMDDCEDKQSSHPTDNDDKETVNVANETQPEVSSAEEQLVSKSSSSMIDLEASDDDKTPKEDLDVAKANIIPPDTDANLNREDHCEKKLDEEVLKKLGRKLQSTLTEYQTNFGSSSSSDRVQQLEHMNSLVLQIAKAGGLESKTGTVSHDSIPRELVKSWSHKSIKKSHRKSAEEKDRQDKKRSRKKKKRRRPDKERREKKDKMTLQSDDEHGERSMSLIW